MKLYTLLLTAGLLCLDGGAQAALHDRGGGMIYDDVLDVTWLQDANYAYTTGYSTSNWGQMTWDEAMAWADQLTYGGFTDWRLPTVGPVNGISLDDNWSYDGSTDHGYNIGAPGSAYPGSTGSELAYMFHINLGNLAVCDISGSCPQAGWSYVPNTSFESGGPSGAIVNIENLRTDGVYWFGTEYADYTPFAWWFGIPDAFQGHSSKMANGYAWAVRDGDVAAVPEPETYALMLAGLGLVGWAARRRSA